jgi:hypothetical protein
MYLRKLRRFFENASNIEIIDDDQQNVLPNTSKCGLVKKMSLERR